MDRRWKPLAAWILAVVLTGSLLIYQRRTGPTYPISVRTIVGGEHVSGRLIRSQETTAPAKVEVVAGPTLRGQLVWRRYPTSDEWQAIEMRRDGPRLVAELPLFQRAAKLEYQVRLEAPNGSLEILPTDGSAILRYKDPVPTWLLLVHILAIFCGPIFAFRGAIATLLRESNALRFAPWVVAFLTLGGFVLGPMMQKYAFDAWWTGWPVGEDLTDTKTLVAWAFWVAAWWVGRVRPKWSLAAYWAALVVMVGVFLIPHSVRGSQVDWTKVPHAQPSARP
ncbi:MAG: hypothetical protein N2109_12855 [Fimbriimonadales bacterium]|nr:hypothetical protein [Fimbriimonadales bacterium]